MLALSEALQVPLGSDTLIAVAVRAVVDGVDSASLSLLAGLSRREEGDARDLIHDVVAELGLEPAEPIDSPLNRWELVRWWCEQITGGELEPEIGGRLIWFHGWIKLGHPSALQPIVLAVTEGEHRARPGADEREDPRKRITDEAALLLNGSWPP